MKKNFPTLNELKEHLKLIKDKHNFKVNEIPFSEFDQWHFSDQKNYLEHSSGKFFRIEGIRVKTNFGSLPIWEQPIINQPEIGILGILSKVFNRTRYYLMQAKMEPGNINILQLSPTCQATKSNFSRVHMGNAPVYLEYFLDRLKGCIIIDQLQSEQGGRFLRKRNRNIVVDVTKDIKVLDNFFWLTMNDIKELLKIDNFINMDARSVISTIPIKNKFYPPFIKDKTEINKLLSWYIDQKVKYELEVEKISLLKLKDWNIGNDSIYQNNKYRYFSVIGVKVEAGTREVTSWTQPMIKDTNIGLIGLIRKNINGVDHYLMQTKVMPGNIDIIDLSPTVSFSNYKYFIDKSIKPRFFNYFLDINPSKVIYDTIQSEEGGRFYHLQTRNMIIEIDENLDIPNNYKWLTYEQIMIFMEKGMNNIETRSLIASL